MNTIRSIRSVRSTRTILAASAFSAALAFPILTALPASAATGTGSITPSITSPVVVSGTGIQTSMSCNANTQAKAYVMRVESVPVQGYTLAATVSIKGYTGPGTYPAAVTSTVSGNGKVYGGAQKATSVTVSETGGSLQFSKTATGSKLPKAAGKTLAGSLTWACPSA
jgi:hypothetical protein